MSNGIYGINYIAAHLGYKQQIGGETVKSNEVNLKDGLSQAELEAIDTNKDGLVTEAEFNAAMSNNNASLAETQSYWQQYLSAYNQKNQQEHKVVTETFDQSGKMTGYNVKQYNAAGNLLIRETNSNNGQVTESALTGSGMINSKVIETDSSSNLGETLVTIDNEWNRIRNVQHPGEPKIDIGGISYFGYTISQVTINGVTYSGINISQQESNGDVTITDNSGKKIAVINHDKGQLSSIQLDFSQNDKAQTSISFNNDGSIKDITTYDVNGVIKTKASAGTTPTSGNTPTSSTSTTSTTSTAPTSGNTPTSSTSTTSTTSTAPTSGDTPTSTTQTTTTQTTNEQSIRSYFEKRYFVGLKYKSRKGLEDIAKRIFRDVYFKRLSFSDRNYLSRTLSRYGARKIPF